VDIKTFKGSDVKILRVEAGLQHGELAKESRVWEKTIRGWELGRIPSETARIKILNFLQKKLGRQDLDQFLKEIAGRPKPPAPVPAPPPKPPSVEAKTVVCRCVNGALLDVPAWENREKPKNWMAVIDVDGASPGGLSRRFLSYGRGDTFYLVEQLTLFDPVEFAADRVFGSHTRKGSR
jgi:transcriptional regulator with XRE-family HTH domain